MAFERNICQQTNFWLKFLHSICLDLCNEIGHQVLFQDETYVLKQQFIKNYIYTYAAYLVWYNRRCRSQTYNRKWKVTQSYLQTEREWQSYLINTPNMFDTLKIIDFLFGNWIRWFDSYTACARVPLSFHSFTACYRKCHFYSNRCTWGILMVHQNIRYGFEQTPPLIL